MIPAARFRLDGDKAWLVVDGDRKCEWWKHDGCRTVSDRCEWTNCPTVPPKVWAALDQPCPGCYNNACHGTGRHVVELEVMCGDCDGYGITNRHLSGDECRECHGNSEISLGLFTIQVLPNRFPNGTYTVTPTKVKP